MTPTTPKFQPGDRVRISMMAMDASFQIQGEGDDITVVPKRDTKDVGIGIIERIVPTEELCVPEEEAGHLSQVAVVEGRFDGHRNDLGQLHCWDYELEPEPH